MLIIMLGIIDYKYISYLAVTAGTSSIIQSNPVLSSQLDDGEEVSTKPACNKDTSQNKTLQRWTRGHFFIVRGSGHIDAWQPLYK